MLLWLSIFLCFPGSAKPSAPAESIRLAGTLSGLGPLGGELGACLLPHLRGGKRGLDSVRQSELQSRSRQPGASSLPAALGLLSLLDLL